MIEFPAEIGSEISDSMILRVSHRLSEILPRVSIDALLISNVRLGIIWTIAFESVCLNWFDHQPER